MEHLSENIIKKATLRFFKAYYKFRPRVGKTTSSFDLETGDGIIVDGSLSFQQEDGSTFFAAFEATSLDSKDEVIFKTQSKILLWDTLAVAFLITCMSSIYGFYYDLFTVKQIGWLGSLSLLTGIFGLSFLTYQYLFQSIKRYRYIYAVEQFKRYHADEQWIAIADDVFSEATDPHLKELKDQCVINGFGLVVVDNELETHILITPSRQEVFGKKRSAMSTLSRDIALQRSRRQQFKLWWNKTLSKLTGQKSTNPLLRYQRSFWNQILLCSASALIISGILFKEAQDAEIAYVNEKKYEKDLSKKAKSIQPETEDFIIDTPFVESSKTKAQPYILVTADEEEEPVLSEKGPDSAASGSEFPLIEILVATLDGEYVAYDCERFFNYKGTKFLIQEGEYPTIDHAQEKIRDLNKIGINANCMWTGCFSEDQSVYVVFIDLLFDKRDEATIIAKSLERKFKFPSGELTIRPITLQKP